MIGKKLRLWTFGAFILIGALAYSNIAGAFFLSDDFDQIGKVRAGNLAVTWGQEHGGFFRPLFILSYFVDVKLWNAAPLGFHSTNILFHTANAFLVFLLSQSLIEEFCAQSSREEAQRVSLAAGLIFLLHPSHTEAVSWISGRADLIAAFFSLLSLTFYVSCWRTKNSARIFFSLLFFALALLAKESAICLPFVVLLIEVTRAWQQRNKEIFRRAIKTVAAFVALLLVFIAARYLAINSLIGGYGASQHLNFSPSWIRDRLLQFSLRAMLPPLPTQLSAILLKPLKSPVFVLFAIVCAALIAAVVAHRHKRQSIDARRPQNIFMWLLVASFLCSLLPVINLRLSLYDTQGERFLYLPSAFSSIALAYVSMILIRRTRFWMLLIGCLLIFYSSALYRSNENWREAARLSQTILDDLATSSEHNSILIVNAPDNLKGAPVFHNGLADALQNFQTARQFTDVRLVALHSIQSVNDPIESAANHQSIAVRLPDEANEFGRVDEHLQCVEIIDHTNFFLRLRLDNCPAAMDVFVFDKGRMQRIATLP
ncbi:MAG: hypothetical protein ACR2LC_14720 [Pyrinomonadaceae bacterium]